jgi:hypothetical protein
MKPLNSDEPGCNYTTSNCVIWQGPDIPCLSLCKGDTVTDVVYKLATEVCDILNTLDINTYDLSCFNLTSCQPDDFKQLIQFLMERVCKLEQCTGCIPNCDGTVTPPVPPVNGNGGCPDCVMAIAPCFYYVNEFGDTVTTMQLQDYVTAIGNRICSNAQNIGAQQRTLSNHEERIVVLETTPPAVYVPPTLVPKGVLPSVPQEMIDVLAATEQQFVELRAATGMPDALYINVAKQPSGLNQEKQLNNSGGTMASIPGWASVVNNLSQSIGNMWLTLSDLRQAVKTIQLNCCPTGCDGIELNLFASLNVNTLSVYVTGTVPTGFEECFPTGTKVTVTDSMGGSAVFNMNLISYLNNPTGFPINLENTPINVSLDLTVEIEPCLANSATNATCKSYLSYIVVNSSSCPAVTYNTTQGSISYSFNSQLGDYTYNIQLWDVTGSTMLSNQVQIISGVQTVSGTFISLGAGTNYKIRLVIQPTACPTCDPTVCPFTSISTNPPTCPAPSAVSAGLTIP